MLCEAISETEEVPEVRFGFVNPVEDMVSSGLFYFREIKLLQVPVSRCTLPFFNTEKISFKHIFDVQFTF